MSKTASVIEINGIRYDAGTGRALTKVKDFAKTRLSASNQVIDGFVKNKQLVEPKKTQTTTKKLTKNKAAVTRSATTAAKHVHKRAERSRTLVRTVVVRPSVRVKEATMAFARPMTRNTNITDSEKAARAKSIPKHSKVSRYGTKTTVSDIAHPVEVGEVITKPRTNASNNAQAASTDPAGFMPSMVASASHQQLERLLDLALFNASSHRETYKKGRSGITGRLFSMPKWLKITILTIVAVIALTLFAWRNIPVVAIKVAGSVANVRASAPSYTPIGFVYSGPAVADNDSVRITYKDTANSSKSYTVTEKKSPLNTESIASTGLIAGAETMTSQVSGTTVYISTNARTTTWVNGGLLYTITNDAGLNSDQLLRIAESIQ